MQIASNNKKFVLEIRELMKGNQNVDNQLIWDCMKSETDADNIYYYCMQIFDNLLNRQKKLYIVNNNEKMLSTLFVLNFYNNKKSKPQKLVQQSQKQISQNKDKFFGSSLWILQRFLISNDMVNFPLEFTSKICMAPLSFEWNLEPGLQLQSILTQQESYVKMNFNPEEQPYIIFKHMCFPEKNNQSRIFAYLYICFIDYMRDCLSLQFQTYSHILNILKTMVHSFRLNWKMQTYLIVLLFFMQTITTFYGLPYKEINIQYLHWLNQLRNYPGRIGFMAAQTFQNIHNELKLPGMNFRKKLRRDFVELDIRFATQFVKNIFIISEQPAFFESVKSEEITKIRQRMIYNVIGGCLSPNKEQLWVKIRKLSAENTFKMYYKVLKIVELTGRLQTYQKISQMQRESILQVMNIVGRPKQFELPSNKNQQQSQFMNMVKTQNKYNFFRYPNYKFQFIPLKTINYSYLKTLIDDYESSHLEFYQPKIPLLFIGDDSQFFKLLQSLSQFLKEAQISLIKRIDLYIVPKYNSTNTLALYLSYKDIWYSRFVYNVFHKDLLIPTPDYSIENCQSLPTYLLAETLEMYVRQAQRTVPIQIYKCILQGVGGGGKNLNQEIYFVSHLLIGTSMQCQSIKIEKSKKYSQYDYMGILLQKHRKKQSLSLSFRFKYYETATTTVSCIQKDVDIDDLVICNIPRYYFMGIPPDPTIQPLSMSILPQMNARLLRKQIQNQQNYKKAQEIHQFKQALKDLYVNHLIESVVIENVYKEGIKVMVDGVLFEGIQRISVIKAKNDKQMNLTLPMKCFLPFD